MEEVIERAKRAADAIAEEFIRDRELTDAGLIAHIASAIREAVAAERERCAKAAEGLGAEWDAYHGEQSGLAALSIAKLIRKG